MDHIRKVGVIGEGKMGSGIVLYLVDFPFELVWVCSEGADMEKTARMVSKRARKSLDAGIIDRTRFESLQVSPVTQDISLLRDCDLVIEAIPENLEKKRALFNRLDKIVKGDAIFTSTSSSINPSEIMPGPETGRKSAGLHFYYPVQSKDMVEVTLSASTTDGTLELIGSFLDSVNRTFITLDEQNSFILNRIFLDFQNAAFRIVHDGECTYLQMDQLVKEQFFSFGVFDYCDSIGLDIMLAAIQRYIQDYRDQESYAIFTSALARLAGAGKLGVKTREGFYKYPMPDQTPESPEHAGEIEEHMRQTWLNACNRFTSTALVSPELMYHAMDEFFGIELSPLDKLLLNFQ